LAPKDQRRQSAFVFGAIGPPHNKRAGLVQPCCSTQTIALHLAERTLGQAPGPHALALTDQAGWLATAKRKTPSTISIIAPPSAPS